MSLLSVIAAEAPRLDLTREWVGYVGVATFLIAYLLIALESKTHLRKSKPVFIAAGIIWMLAAVAYARAGDVRSAGDVLRRDIGSFGELFLFILAAMTFVNTMEERQLFGALRSEIRIGLDSDEPVRHRLCDALDRPLRARHEQPH